MESAVIGLAHPDLGEVVVAILVAEKGKTPDLDNLAIIFSESLTKYKQPRKLLIIPELPRNTMGKVHKNILRQEYKDVLIQLD
jgi:malonyl-CoA/methylmalonyl-CoA synthetase